MANATQQYVVCVHFVPPELWLELIPCADSIETGTEGAAKGSIA